MKAIIQDYENKFSMQMLTENNIESLKEKLKKKLDEHEGLFERNAIVEKELVKIRSDYKESRLYSESLESELSVTKQLAKEK
jgi:hypothetical protein